MSRPELDQLNRRYADVVAQLDAMEASEATVSPTGSQTKGELLVELGKIEHWLWVLEPD
ncbi:MAG: hypothetical protein GWP14_07760 [Actinobacteria bacterium]|nr:hypothetical protein [Actinomycetota bacterium]